MNAEVLRNERLLENALVDDVRHLCDRSQPEDRLRGGHAEVLVTYVAVAVGAIGVSALLGIALGRAAARGDAELEDRRMRTLVLRKQTITAGRITSSRQIYEGLALRPQAPLVGSHTAGPTANPTRATAQVRR